MLVTNQIRYDSLNLSHHKFSPIHTTISTINIIVLFTYGISNIFIALKAHDIPNKLIIAVRGLSPIANNL